MSNKFTLTEENVKKVLKGAAIAGTGAFALFILNFFGTIEISNPVWASFATWFIPTATNLIKEFLKEN